LLTADRPLILMFRNQDLEFLVGDIPQALFIQKNHSFYILSP
jgi:hypothetical protein